MERRRELRPTWCTSQLKRYECERVAKRRFEAASNGVGASLKPLSADDDDDDDDDDDGAYDGRECDGRYGRGVVVRPH